MPGEHPGDHCAPVVPDDMHLLDAQVLEQGPVIARDLQRIVVAQARRHVGVAAAEGVGRNAAITGLVQHLDLGEPHLGRIRKAVQQQHTGTSLVAWR